MFSLEFRRAGRHPVTAIAAAMVLAGIQLLHSDAAAAQDGTRFIDRGRADQGLAPPPSGVAVPPSPGPGRVTAPPAADSVYFVLDELRIEGVTVFSRQRLWPLYGELIGRTIAGSDIYEVADAIGGLYRDAGYALHAAVVPEQDFTTGVVRIVVLEGHVRRIVIAGETAGADLSLISGYGERIVDDKPLRRSVLERNVLLMNDLPGVRVGSRFVPVPNGGGAVDLELVVERERFEVSAGLDNQGSPLVGEVQGDVNAALHSILFAGDRIQASYGYPANLERFDYYTAGYSVPVGGDGTVLHLDGSHLRTEPEPPDPTGRATTVSLRASHPLIRATGENLIVFGSFDGLNSDSAVLGDTISTERTRSLRVGAAYGLRDSLFGADRAGQSSAGLTVSQGLDVFGAEGSRPDYTKVNLQLGRDQLLFRGLLLRFNAAGQYVVDPVNSSERFVYGGGAFGRAFLSAEFSGDDGVVASAELAYAFDEASLFGVVALDEVYAFADAGWLWSSDLPAPFDRVEASSAGGGLRINVLDRLVLDVEVSRPLERPSFATTDDDWQVHFAVRARY